MPVSSACAPIDSLRGQKRCRTKVCQGRSLLELLFVILRNIQNVRMQRHGNHGRWESGEILLGKGTLMASGSKAAPDQFAAVAQWLVRIIHVGFIRCARHHFRPEPKSVYAAS